MSNVVHDLYGNKLRVRACGLCVLNEKLLLVNHKFLSDSNFWAPPGGGIEFSESAGDALIREFNEETGLKISPRDFRFACELLKAPLHAIELFFKVDVVDGTIKKGVDPESDACNQIIAGVKWMSWEEIEKLPPSELHGAFQKVAKPREILDLRGYFKL